MTQFEFLSVAISFVLGLAVTVLLTSVVTAFRSRRQSRMSWLPFAWAFYVLVMQFDLWWEIYGLVSMENWSVVAFVLLLLLAVFLFAAGALFLPSGSGDYPADLYEYFMQDGRWGVVLIAAFIVTAIVANVALFDMPLFGNMNLWNLGTLCLLAIMAVVRRPPIQSVITIAFGAWLGGYLWVFVPASY